MMVAVTHFAELSCHIAAEHLPVDECRRRPRDARADTAGEITSDPIPVDWDGAVEAGFDVGQLSKDQPPQATFADLPSAASKAKKAPASKKKKALAKKSTKAVASAARGKKVAKRKKS